MGEMVEVRLDVRPRANASHRRNESNGGVRLGHARPPSLSDRTGGCCTRGEARILSFLPPLAPHPSTMSETTATAAAQEVCSHASGITELPAGTAYDEPARPQQNSAIWALCSRLWPYDM